MTGLQKLTWLILLIVAFGLGAYDFWVGYQTQGYATISWLIYTESLQRPALPFMFGFLCGHIFGTMPDSGGQTRAEHWFKEVFKQTL
jgi:hypothetical protein